MRRSGTSLTANLLVNMGFYFENDARQPDRNNPRGYWESRRILDLNSGLLFELGGNQEHLPAPRPKWEESDSLEPKRLKVRALLDEYKKYDRWGMKDTRFAITLPFWIPLLGPDTSIILCMRNPLATVRSWSKMDRINRDSPAAFETWYATTASSIRNTTRMKRLLVHYEDYLAAPEITVARICAFLGSENNPSLLSTFSSELVHQQPSTAEFLNNPRASEKTKLLYLSLQGVGIDDSKLTEVDHALSNFQPGLPPLGFRLKHNLIRTARRTRALFRTGT